MKKNKILSFILLTAMVLTGCGNSVPVESPAEAQTETLAEAETETLAETVTEAPAPEPETEPLQTGPMNFCAVVSQDGTDAAWCSNVITME